MSIPSQDQRVDRFILKSEAEPILADHGQQKFHCAEGDSIAADPRSCGIRDAYHSKREKSRSPILSARQLDRGLRQKPAFL
jgi:hypothetical protein